MLSRALPRALPSRRLARRRTAPAQVMCLDALEDIKARLLRHWGDAAAAVAVTQPAAEQPDADMADMAGVEP